MSNIQASGYMPTFKSEYTPKYLTSAIVYVLPERTPAHLLDAPLPPGQCHFRSILFRLKVFLCSGLDWRMHCITVRMCLIGKFVWQVGTVRSYMWLSDAILLHVLTLSNLQDCKPLKAYTSVGDTYIISWNKPQFEKCKSIFEEIL